MNRRTIILLTLSACVFALGSAYPETRATTIPGGTVLVAQNAADQTEASGETTEESGRNEVPSPQTPTVPLPPLPEPKTVVGTEKPIDGGLKLREPIKKVVVTPDETVPSAGDEEKPDVSGESAVDSGKLPENLRLMEELSLYNVPSANLRTMKCVIDEEYNLRSIVYGEELGYLHILETDSSDNLREVWKSPPLNGAVRGVFVEDVDDDGKTDIVAYTSNGDFFIYDYDNHTLKYKTPDGMYTHINCMVIADMDDSPELELLFIGVKSGDGDANRSTPPGNLIQFDPQSQFEDWISQEKYTATDMIIGNVDTDEDLEIVLNTGEILDYRFKGVEWKSTVAFGSRLYLIDLDNDGILELVTEYDQSYIRIIDVDQRQEKW